MSEIINAMFSLKQNARIKLRVLFTELEPSQSPFRGRECSSERLFFLSRGQKLYYRQIHLETLKGNVLSPRAGRSLESSTAPSLNSGVCTWVSVVCAMTWELSLCVVSDLRERGGCR